MIRQIDYEKWLDRIDNVLALQKECGYELMTLSYNRKELIELRLMISALYSEEVKENKQ